MSINSVRLGQLVNLQGLPGAPANPVEGDIYYDTNANKYYFRNDTAAWIEFVPSDGSVPFTDDLDMGGNQIVNLADPVNGNDAASKSYVDAAANGFSWKSPALVASTVDVPITGLMSANLTLDGVLLAADNRVLLKNQTLSQFNGVYDYKINNPIAGSYTLVRSADAETGLELLQASLFITSGTTQADSGWVCTANAIIVPDTTPLPFVIFASGSGNANAALSNLITTSINQSLIPNVASTRDIGATSFPWNRVHTSTITVSQISSPGTNLLIFTPNASNAGIQLYTGTPTVGAAGGVTIFTGALSGTLTAGTGISIYTGNSTSTSSSALISIATGTSTAAASGAISVASGTVTGAFASGALSIITGNSSAGNSGAITIQTGTAGSSRGPITISGEQLNITSAANLIITSGNYFLSNTDLTFGNAINHEVNILGTNNTGKRLTLRAGNVEGGSNFDGGELRLTSGVTSGNGLSYVTIYAVTSGQGPGAAFRDPQQIALFNGSGMRLGGTAGTAPAASALLDMAGTVGALLLPRLNNAQEGALSAANGMFIYNTQQEALRVYKNAIDGWVSITMGAAGASRNLANLLGPTLIDVDLLPRVGNSINLGSSDKKWVAAWATTVYTSALAEIGSQSVVINVDASALLPAFNDSISLGSSSLHFMAAHLRQGLFYDSGTNLKGQIATGITAPDASVCAIAFQNLSSQESALGILTDNSAANNSTATNSILIETGNKTAGTAQSGNIVLQTGTGTGSFPFVRGFITLNAGYISLAADLGVFVTSTLQMNNNVIEGVADTVLGDPNSKTALNAGSATNQLVMITPTPTYPSPTPLTGYQIPLDGGASTVITPMNTVFFSTIMNYSLQRFGNSQTGQLMISRSNADVVDVAEVSSATGSLGIEFSATVSAGAVTLIATLTAGDPASMSFNTVFQI